MHSYLIGKNYNIKKVTEQYIVAEGEVPVCLVAHLDTVAVHPPQDFFYDSEEKVMWSPQLLGADDRAGVYAIIQIIESGYRPHIIFTTEEETGCGGSLALVNSEPNCPLEILKAIFQLDRHGEKDCVFYNCDNKEFEKYVESFGFKTSTGSFTDISVLAPAYGVAAANLSIGYYNEHSVAEYLRCDILESTIEKVKDILDDYVDMPFFKYIEKEKLIYPKEDICVGCGEPLIKGHFRIVDDFPYGYKVCEKCQSLFSNPNDDDFYFAD